MGTGFKTIRYYSNFWKVLQKFCNHRTSFIRLFNLELFFLHNTVKNLKYTAGSCCFQSLLVRWIQPERSCLIFFEWLIKPRRDLATRLDVIQIVRIWRSYLYKNSWQLSIHEDCIWLLLIWQKYSGREGKETCETEEKILEFISERVTFREYSKGI